MIQATPEARISLELHWVPGARGWLMAFHLGLGPRTPPNGSATLAPRLLLFSKDTQVMVIRRILTAMSWRCEGRWRASAALFEY